MISRLIVRLDRNNTLLQLYWNVCMCVTTRILLGASKIEAASPVTSGYIHANHLPGSTSPRRQGVPCSNDVHFEVMHLSA